LILSNATVWPLRVSSMRVGVVCAKREQIPLAVVVRALLEIIGERRIDGHHERGRRVFRVERAVAGLAAEKQRGLRASEAERDRRDRLVEAVFLEIGRADVVGDDRLHLRRLHLADKTFDGAGISGRLNRLVQFPVARPLGDLDRLVLSGDVDAIDLVAIESDGRFVAQIECRSIESLFLERAMAKTRFSSLRFAKRFAPVGVFCPMSSF